MSPEHHLEHHPHADEPPPVAVGADGSAGSRTALAWAIAEATRRGCGVSVWSVAEPRPGEAAELALIRAEDQLHRTVDGLLAGRAELPMCLTHTVVGGVVDTLVAASNDVGMLVLGTHRVTGLIHSAMRPVAEACIALAHCPVVIVPTLADEDPRQSTALAQATH